MELNALLFPAPPPSYEREEFEKELIWVPKNDMSHNAIPCLLLQCEEGSSKLLLYFHGNAEDLGLTLDMMDLFRTILKIHVMAMEYPGYGLYSGKPNAARILEDANCVFSFVETELKIKPHNIFVFGRSIGSGPATWLARHRFPGCLLLMSPYTSIRAVVRNIAGKLAQYLVAERFKNIDSMPYIICPTFIVHGQKDTLIPYSHAQKLHEQCAGLCYLHLPEEMDHNNFDYYQDLLLPIATFWTQAEISLTPDSAENRYIFVPEQFLVMPEEQPLPKNKGRMNKLMKRLS